VVVVVVVEIDFEILHEQVGRIYGQFLQYDDVRSRFLVN
jgi:hypothetical protein